MSIFKDAPEKEAEQGNFVTHNTDFQSGLTVGGAGQSHEIDPRECAIPAAAQRLMAHLQTLGLSPALVSDWPLGSFVAGSAFAQSAKVPYFNFPREVTADNPATTSHVNVARLLVEYEHYGKFTDALMLQWYGPKQ